MCVLPLQFWLKIMYAQVPLASVDFNAVLPYPRLVVSLLVLTGGGFYIAEDFFSSIGGSLELLRPIEGLWAAARQKAPNWKLKFGAWWAQLWGSLCALGALLSEQVGRALRRLRQEVGRAWSYCCERFSLWRSPSASWPSASAMAGAAALVGSFVLVASVTAGEWDEHLITAMVPGMADRYLVLTTEDLDPHPFCWKVLVAPLAAIHPMAGHGGARAPGPVPRIRAGSINYLSVGTGAASDMWAPTAAERAAAINQGTTYAQALADQVVAATIAGRPPPTPFVELVVGGAAPYPGGAAAGGMGLPPPLAGLGAPLLPIALPLAPMAAAAPAAPAALPVGGVVPPGLPQSGSDLGIEAFAKALEQLQLASKSSKKKDSKEKRSKSRRRRRSRSGSRSRSESSRSSDSASSERYPTWDPTKGKKRLLSKQVAAMEGLRFRRRSDLLAFAGRHPGVLTCHMMTQIRA